ncbi:MAG: hypothetical protein ACR2ML_14555 [Solirubrobacteraceae bacterium]
MLAAAPGGRDEPRRRQPACGARIAALYLALLSGLAAIVYGPHIASGGFAWDDWENASTTALPPAGFLGPFDLRQAVYEPGLSLALPLPHLLFGPRPAWHLALAAVLGVAMSTCTFTLLRQLGVPALAAALVGALTLVFPRSDSVRLWATAGLNQIAVCLYLVAGTLGLRSIEARRTRARRLGGWALWLYVASVLTYPITVVAVILTPALYRLRVPWERAWRAGARPAAAGVAALVYVSLTTTKPTQPLHGQLDHGVTIVEEWLSLLAEAVLPVDGLPAVVVLAAAAAVALWGAAAARRRAHRGKTDSAAALQNAIAMTWVGALAALVGYLIFVPGEGKYSPLADGLYNRGGLLAGPGVATAVVGIVIVVCELALGCVWRRGVALATTLLAGVLLACWSVRVSDDAEQWDRAALRSREVLAVLDAKVPSLPAGATVYTDGHRRHQAPGIPVFASSFDLDGALTIRRGDASLSAYPIPGALRCGASSAAPATPPYDRVERARYGRLFVVDVARRRAWPIASRADCQRARARLGR